MRRERVRDPPRTHRPVPLCQEGWAGTSVSRLPADSSTASGTGSVVIPACSCYTVHGMTSPRPGRSPSRILSLNQGRPSIRQKPTSTEEGGNSVAEPGTARRVPSLDREVCPDGCRPSGPLCFGRATAYSLGFLSCLVEMLSFWITPDMSVSVCMAANMKVGLHTCRFSWNLCHHHRE